MPQKNDRIGSYILLEKIGRGGFGEVWLAEKRTSLITTRFALKLPHKEEVDLNIIRAEAEVWCSVSGHPNVLPIIEADIYNGQVVIASEYVQGGSLADWLADNDPPLESAVQLTRCILDGLEFLHSKRVVHRDLKPDNILLQQGIPRLTDFGISKLLREEKTSTRNISGTLAYMPPEAFEGKHSYQTDLWSIGVIFYQMLAGRLPFERDEQPALIKSILLDEPAPMPLAIPLSVREFIKKALSKDLAERFQTAAEMKKALSATASGEFKFETATKSPALKNQAQRLLPEDFSEKSTINLNSTSAVAASASGENKTLHQIDHTTDEQNSAAHQETKPLGKETGRRAPLSKATIILIVLGVVLLPLTGMFLASYNRQPSQLPQPTSSNQKVESNSSAAAIAVNKRYLEMSESEKQQFVSEQADKVMQMIKANNGGSESEITTAGKAAIKEAVDSFAKRRWQEPKDSCGTQTWNQSDLGSVLKRGVKIAPDITAGFKEKEIAPLVGIYLAMNESEFCPCTRGWTNGLGIYQFSHGTAIEYGLKAVKDATTDNPDERCNAEPASRAAATLVKKLLAEDFGGGMNRTTFALTAYDEGEPVLRQNIKKAKDITGSETVSFWTLLENKEKMSEEFERQASKYLPRFFAAAIVGENPQVFDVQIQPLSSYVK